MNLRKYIIAFISVMHLFPDSMAQDTLLKKAWGVSLAAQYGFIWAHSKEVENTSGSHPLHLEADLHTRILKSDVWDDCHCFPRIGFMLSWSDYDNAVLGNGMTAAYYVEPFIMAHHRISFSVKGAAGISYLTKPYNEKSNPHNLSYSMKWNAYLALAIGINLRLNNFTDIKLSALYNHISNGGIQDPNKGINYPAAGLSCYYSFQPYHIPANRNKTSRVFRKEPLRKDVQLFATSKIISPGESARYLIYGAGMMISKRMSAFNGFTAAAEIIADYSLQERLQRENRKASMYRAGLLAGNEFLAGRFIFSQQLGIYAYKSAPYYDLLYQRWGLTYRLTNYFAFGMHLLTHRHVANFIDGRIVISF